MNNELIYIATPYLPTEDDYRYEYVHRFLRVTNFAAKLMGVGRHVYSPITHSHPMAIAERLPGGWDYWCELDQKFLKICTCMVVFCQDGWDRSIGVAAEMKYAEIHNMPIILANPTYDDDNIRTVVNAIECARVVKDGEKFLSDIRTEKAERNAKA
jgi:hypothetical protein